MEPTSYSTEEADSAWAKSNLLSLGILLSSSNLYDLFRPSHESV